MAKLGLNAKLYRGTAGSTAATEVKNIRDLTFNDEKGSADISVRGSTFELGMPTLRKITLDFEMVVDETDADYAAILAAYVAGTAIAIKCVSSTYGSGVDMDCLIQKMNRKEPLKDIITADVSLVPTYITRYPAAVVGSGS
jgi:hypothetical protein